MKGRERKESYLVNALVEVKGLLLQQVELIILNKNRLKNRQKCTLICLLSDIIAVCCTEPVQIHINSALTTIVSLLRLLRKQHRINLKFMIIVMFQYRTYLRDMDMRLMATKRPAPAMGTGSIKKEKVFVLYVVTATFLGDLPALVYLWCIRYVIYKLSSQA